MDRVLTGPLRLFDLRGKVALVTGAGRGIGRTSALALAGAGADVVLVGRSREPLEQVAGEVRALDRRALVLPADVSDEAQVEALFQEVAVQWGSVNILVNNAGINIRKPVLELSAREWDEVMATNLRGYFLCARAAGRQMVARRSGKVINVASIMGTVALPGLGPYAASKGGVLQLTKVLALEWATANVQVNAIGPGYTETPLTEPLRRDAARNRFITERTPMGRWAETRDLDGTIVYLASAASDFVTGQVVYVDGGWLAW